MKKRLKYEYVFFIFLLISLITINDSADASEWKHYALACPFMTVQDSITADEFTALWSGQKVPGFIDHFLILETDKSLLENRFGKAGNTVQDLTDIEKNIRKIDASKAVCAILPVADLQPDLKRISIDEYPAVWDSDYVPENDILAFQSDQSDFDLSEETSLLMTGTTALARTTAYKMYLNGYEYPGMDIKPVFDGADIRHVSNESSFWSLCPEPTHTEGTMQFCTPLDDWHLFEYLGVNVVELTGNHLRDYDWQPFLETLDLFDAEGFHYYGAGRNYEEADKPYKVSHNGNNFIFLGCNIAGPDHVFVDDTRPGVNKCDFDKMEQDIRKYSSEGYLVIASVQYYETYSRVPTSQQAIDFQRLSDAGAVIVSGSQAHYSQTMKPYSDRFIHYGLGNLFFDQMDIPVAGTRQEFLDKYIFYDGKLIQVELITALLLDYSRPRLMVPYERTDFLTEIFSHMEN